MSPSAASIPGREVIISNDNQGPVVNIASWLGVTIMIMSVFTRMGSKYSIVRKWTVDDTLVTIAMIFGAALAATISMMVANGLGQPQATLSDLQIMDFQKYGYASQLLYIPALYLAKLSTLLYLRALSPASRFASLNTYLEVFIVLCGLSVELAIAFQCHLPSPWATISGKCFNRVAFWDINGAFDILTDVAIISLPLYLVWPLQMPWRRKGLVVVAFGSRILIIPLTIFRIYYLSTMSSPSLPDQTFSLYHGYLATVIQLNFAIIMACVPFLKPFMESMSSGDLASTVHAMDSSYGKSSKLSTLVSSISNRKAPKPKGSYQMDNLSESRLNEEPGTSGGFVSNKNSEQNARPSDEGDEFHFGITSANDLGDLGTLRLDKVTSFSHAHHSPPGENESGTLGGDKMIIKRTTEWNVQEEYERPTVDKNRRSER